MQQKFQAKYQVLNTNYLCRIKAKLEAIIYAAEDPITLDQMAALLKDDLLALKTALPARLRPQSENAAASHPQPEQAEDHLGAVEESTPAAGEESKRKV